jgi:ASC-1-like (ASCH) protein
MKLNAWPFDAIKNGKKDIEVRLNDEKRKRVKIGDTIVFSCVDSHEQISVTVIALYPYATFEDLYIAFPSKRFGCEGDSIKTMVEETYAIYTREEEFENGVLAIHILLN